MKLKLINYAFFGLISILLIFVNLSITGDSNEISSKTLKIVTTMSSANAESTLYDCMYCRYVNNSICMVDYPHACLGEYRMF
jgi:hypothetical protein